MPDLTVEQLKELVKGQPPFHCHRTLHLLTSISFEHREQVATTNALIPNTLACYITRIWPRRPIFGRKVEEHGIEGRGHRWLNRGRPA